MSPQTVSEPPCPNEAEHTPCPVGAWPAWWSVVEHYEDHGWRVVGAEELIADRDRWRTAFESLHARLLRDLPGDASELPPPDDGYWARNLDELLTFAAQLAHETETGARTIPDDTDNERA